MKTRWKAIAGVMLALTSGCQCCPLMDPVWNTVDDLNDTHVYFDRFYNPKLDISRMTRPDWCSPFNRLWCQRCCNNGCYDRYDECNQYPPSYPYQYPGNVMPPPTIRTSRGPKQADPDMILESDLPPRSPDPAGNPIPTPMPGSGRDQ
jgi:hypothetical protein